MKQWSSGAGRKNTAVALGNFDGVHVGHRHILSSCVSWARENGLDSVAWTFRTHPQHVLAAESAGDVIDFDQKISLLDQIGLDGFVAEEFQRVRDLSPQEFCDRILLGELGARAVFCGFNFRFGKNGAGDTAFLQSYLGKRGVHVFVSQPICRGGQVVSSTRIRSLLREGKVDEVKDLLDRYYSVSFPVEHGKRLGRQLGFPTLNQSFPEGFVIPQRGVYAVEVSWEDKRYGGVCNVGVRPTVDQSSTVTAETHVFDFSGDLYGKKVSVSFVRFLRPEKTFSSLEELRRQMERDKEAALRCWKERQ